MITEKEVIAAAKTLRDFCIEHVDRCSHCPFSSEVCRDMIVPPCYWNLDLEETSEGRKEPKKMKRVPFDFNKKEDRDALRGRWIKWKEYEDETQITDFDKYPEYWAAQNISSSMLFEEYIFLDGEDAGQPVGKMVEEA